MKNLEFYILDVFAESKYAGNQLAVFRNAGDLKTDEMQIIALEMNYSETTFILSEDKREGGYDVRIFTPAEEIPFAGHPTLGTAYIIRNEMETVKSDEIKLNLKAGQIPVSFGSDGEVIWMRQNPAVFRHVLNHDRVAECLNLHTEDLDSRFPVQEVSTGTPFIIAPLKSLQAIKRAHINLSKFMSMVDELEGRAILLFCPETYNENNDLNVRMFADYYGVPEDPATGSANGCLAGYLVKYDYFDSEEIDIRVEQGYEIKRPSLLYLRSAYKDSEIRVEVGGKVILVAKGNLL